MNSFVRLTDEATRLLDLLAKKHFGTKTNAIENAIRALARAYKIK